MDTPEPDLDSMTFHVGNDEEIETSWFVVFDGDGEDRDKAAPVSEGREPGRFYGFWTYEPALVDEVLAYLRNDRRPVSSSADTAGTAD